MPDDIRDFIETLLDLLSSERIRREIEYPIDKACVEFQFPEEDTITQSVFNKVIGDFVKFIFEKALRFPRLLSDREALSEAIHLLIHYSDAEKPDRYAAILLKVMTGGTEELKKTLLQLSEIIRELERQKYTQWVFTCHFNSLGWNKQCQIVSFYKEFLGHDLSEEFQKRKPEQWVPYFKDLINSDLMWWNVVNQMGFGKGESSWEETIS